MPEAEGEGELVGTGGFRVAGARALEILRQSQLDERFWRPLLWLRLAAALGARRVEVTASATNIVFRLDGTPLSRDLLEQPFALFDEEARRPEARWLPYALVHSITERVTVHVSSGRGSARRSFKYDAAGRVVPAPPTPGDGTVVFIGWPIAVPELTLSSQGPWLWFKAKTKPAATRIEEADAVPFELTTPLGDVTPWERRKDPEAGLLTGYRRRVRVRLAPGPSRLTLHHYGVRVYGAELGDLALPLSVDVDDPNLVLDGSLNAPVDGPDMQRSVAGGLAAAEKHGLRRLEHHAKTMRLTSGLLLSRPSLRRLWGLALLAEERVDRRVPWLIRAVNAFSGGSRPSGDSLRVVRAGEFTAYLRAAALGRLRGRAIDARDPLRKALWETPLVFSATGRPLSLLDLDLDERPCSVWEKASPAPAGAGAMMPWGLSSQDVAFVRRFPKRKARVG